MHGSVKRHPTNDLNTRLHYISELFSAFVKKNAVLCVAASLALITSFIVPVDEKYISYFDFKTLSCLFCTLAVIGGLKNLGVFEKTAHAIIKKAGTLRTAVTLLVFITYFGSMLIANDMALITFLPLGYYVLTSTGREEYMAFTFIMQNIAANLGGMLTPFGNPQNLFLYTRFNIPDMEFMQIMLIPFISAAVLIVLCCFVVKNEKVELKGDEVSMPDVKKTVLYLILFAFSIAIVFRVIPYVLGLIIIPLAVLLLDKKVLTEVDYPLLLTFVCFFIFAGNMSRIDVINNVLSLLMEKSTLLVSVVSCQFISNVPSAVLLSNFTENYRELLMGVNIGGAGTLIASLASLITFKEYVSHDPAGTKRYIGLFSLMNFAFLIILTLISYFTL
ncbi:MAG: citrate transporter [Ruminococcaceae bacterium]|nr:citrate transporter [Oscillospiraceae bacterium]